LAGICAMKLSSNPSWAVALRFILPTDPFA
jgi:hypothetical protein